MKLLSFLLIFFLGIFIAPKVDLDTEILESKTYIECVDIASEHEGKVLNELLFSHGCCPCANALTHCEDSPEECWNEFEDCLDDLYGSE